MKKLLAFLNPANLAQKPLPHHLAAVVTSLLLVATGAFLGGRTAITNASSPLGVDVSGAGQGYLSCQWFNNASASGVQFFLIKAGGDDVGEYQDAQFSHNIGCARATGRHVGTYFFASPGADSPQTQAAHYAAILNANGGVRVGEATMDDLETGSGDLAGFAQGFDSTIQTDEGVKPLLYSYQSFFYSHGLSGNSTIAGSSYLNDANWYYGTPPNPIPNWPQLEVWQWSSTGCTAGVCPVDQDYQVAGWPGKPAPPAPPPPPPTPSPYVWHDAVYHNATDGYTLSGYGQLKAQGAAAAASSAPAWPGWDIARSAVVVGGGQGGLVLDGWGGLHPFGIDGVTPTVSGNPYWPGWDIARQIALSAQGGYVLDAWGGLHAITVDGATAPKAVGNPYWPSWSIARDVVMIPGTNEGYVLDGWGGVHAFNGAPAVTATGYWSGWDIARSITLNPDGKSGYVLDGWGGIHSFAATGSSAPAVCGNSYWPGWDVAADIVVTATASGYTIDDLGGIHPFHAC